MKEQYKLYKGDCLEVMDQLIEQEIKVDMILCDPPYGTTACKWDSVIPFDAMWERLNKLIKSNGAIVLFGSEPFSSHLRMSNIKNYKYDWVWNKIQPTGIALCKIQPMKSHEIISIFGNGRLCYYPQMEKREKEINTKNWKMDKLNSENGTFKTNNFSVAKKVYTEKYPTTVLTYHKSAKECNNTKRVHPTQKPVDLLEYLIKTYTNEGELILDFTMGSGSTGVACINTGRKFIGIELDEKYFNIAENRIEEAVNKKEELFD